MLVPVDATNLSYDDTSDGEMVVHSLYPDKYEVFIQFGGLGFESKRLENIKVEKNRTTEIDVMIDPHDKTGIEGKVIDKNGNPLKNVEVFLSPTLPVAGDFSTNTDQNGYYRLTGVPGGIFHLRVFLIGKGRIFLLGTIEIEKNKLLKKDIDVNWPK
jgi:hypothetical protein